MRAKFRIQRVQHQSRLHERGARRDVRFDQLVEVFRIVDHQCRADRLTALGAARAARQDRHAFFSGDRDRRARGFCAARHDHADGLDLVDGRVSGIPAARRGIE